LYSYHGVKLSPAPYFDLEKEYQVQRAIRKLIQKGLIQSAHDCADGGLFITLLESAMVNNLGFDISTDEDFRKDAFLFGEAQGRVVVSVKDSDEDAFIDFMSITSVEFTYIGDVAETDIVIDDEVFFSVAEAKEIYDTVLEKKLEQVE
jgi:phosphoribosylformylglycinamidine synthase